MAILLTPGMSNLAKLSAIHLLGPIGGYSTIGTLKAPDLQELVLDFDGFGHDHDVANPVLPLFETGALTGLTKLEISSFMHFRQVNVLPWHLAIDSEGAFSSSLMFRVLLSATSPSCRGHRRCKLITMKRMLSLFILR